MGKVNLHKFTKYLFFLRGEPENREASVAQTRGRVYLIVGTERQC